MTFLLSGLPARDDVEELTRLIEDAGGTVCREVPRPRRRLLPQLWISTRTPPRKTWGADASVVGGARDASGDA